MMIRITLLIALLVVTGESFSQAKAVPIKVAEFGDERQATEDFTKGLDIFVKRLSESPKSTHGLITVSGEDYILRIKIARSRVKSDAELKRRVDIVGPGAHYDKRWPRSEFWLIPANGQPPYVAFTSDADCPALEITGPSAITRGFSLATYSIDYPEKNWLDEPFRFKWSVTNGKVLTGQGTRAITVNPFNDRKKVVVSIKVEGLDEDSFCIEKASFTTGSYIRY